MWNHRALGSITSSQIELPQNIIWHNKTWYVSACTCSTYLSPIVYAMVTTVVCFSSPSQKWGLAFVYNPCKKNSVTLLHKTMVTSSMTTIFRVVCKPPANYFADPGRTHIILFLFKTRLFPPCGPFPNFPIQVSYVFSNTHTHTHRILPQLMIALLVETDDNLHRIKFTSGM